MITWIKEKALWIIGGIVLLFSTYLFGRKDGKNAIKNDTNEKLVEQAKVSRNTSNLSFDELARRMSEFGDK